MNESRLQRLSRWCDPQWLLLTALMLAPALGVAVLGRLDKASFFLGAAIYFGTLRWLGWVLITRHFDGPLRFLLFPAEALLGLALVVLWFYLRNVIGLLAPSAYCLCELKILSAFVVVAHLLAALHWWRTAGVTLRAWLRDNRPALVTYALFVLTFSAALYSVSGARHVESTDPLYHAFVARVYVNDGMFLSRFNGSNPLIYPSGFGAMNAVTVALSTLTPVQAVNLQHVLWTIAGLFLVTGAVAWFCRRPLLLLQATPLVFLFVQPLHNLPPMTEYQHTPRQAATPLFLAIALLPLLLKSARRSAWFVVALGILILCALTVLLNPSSAPFTAVAAVLAMALHLWLGIRELKFPVLPAAAAYIGLALFVLVLTFAADRYYAPMLTGSKPRVTGQVQQAEPFQFSHDDAMKHVNTLPLARLQYQSDRVQREHYLPLLAFVLCAGAALAVIFLKLRLAAEPGRQTCLSQLLVLAAGALTASVIAKFAAGYLAGGLVPNAWDTNLLKAYIGWSAIRLELLLLFASVAAAGTLVYFALERAASARSATAATAVLLLAGVLAIFPSTDQLRQAALTKLKIFDFGGTGTVSADDIALTRWIDANLPPDKGLIGLAAMTRAPGMEQHIYPLGGAMALPLYGRHYNFVFFQAEPNRGYSYDDYVARVQNALDARWLLDNNIRYFYVARNSLYSNDGLKRALEDGTLQPLKIIGDSGVYTVTVK